MSQGLTYSDLLYLKRIDQAFDEKQGYEKYLAQQNCELAKSCERWIKQSKRHYRAAAWWCAAAMTLAAILLLTWAAIIWGVLHG